MTSGKITLPLSKTVFYGWVMVAVFLIIDCTMVGMRFSFGVFFKSLEAEFNLTRAATSGLFSVYMIFCAIFALVGGWALDRYGPRLVLSLMGLFTGLSLLATSQATAMWQLYLTYSFLLALGTGSIYPVIMSSLSHWFRKKRGLVMGIAGSGGPLGTIIFTPFAALLISSLGWRMSYIVSGLGIGVIVILLAQLLRRDPYEIGALPDGETVTLEVNVESPRTGGITLLQAFRNRNFWLLFAAWVLGSITITMVLTHIVPYATDVGLSALEAATIVSVIGAFSIAARVFVGRISDILGGKAPGIIMALFRAMSLVGLIWTGELWTFYLFAVVYGLSWGGLSLALTSVSAQIFTGRSLGIIMATLELGFAVGAAIGPYVAGVVFDVYRSYSLAWLMGAATAVLALLCLAAVRHSSRAK